MNKYSIFRFVVLVALLTGLFWPSTVYPPVVQAAWLAGWDSKLPITITNTGAALTDYQVRIDLDTINFDFDLANSDCLDIRFAATDGITLLPYWLETWSAGDRATFWVKVPSLPFARGILTAINNQGWSCSENHYWVNGGWLSYYLSIGLNNFSILPDEGYFVKFAANSSFTP